MNPLLIGYQFIRQQQSKPHFNANRMGIIVRGTWTNYSLKCIGCLLSQSNSESKPLPMHWMLCSESKPLPMHWLICSELKALLTHWLLCSESKALPMHWLLCSEFKTITNVLIVLKRNSKSKLTNIPLTFETLSLIITSFNPYVNNPVLTIFTLCKCSHPNIFTL